MKLVKLSGSKKGEYLKDKIDEFDINKVRTKILETCTEAFNP
jgi:hypothetical protein